MLKRELGELPETVEQLTGGGGRHLFFKYTSTNTPKAIRKGIDFKTDKGYVLLPPSLHESGQRYRWNGHSIFDAVRIAPLPQWVIAEINRCKTLAKESRRPRSRRGGSLIRAGQQETHCLPSAQVNVCEVADRLGLIKSRDSFHCWRPENHANQDAHPSVKFWRDGNALQCFVCGDGPNTPVSLVMSVEGVGLTDALCWLDREFPGAVDRTAAAQDVLVRSGLFANLSPTARAVAVAMPHSCHPEQSLGTLPMN